VDAAGGVGLDLFVHRLDHAVRPWVLDQGGAVFDPFSLAQGNAGQNSNGADELKGGADRGYFNSEDILKGQEAGIVPIVPKPIHHLRCPSGGPVRQVRLY
jgi:hypothetical protein